MNDLEDIRRTVVLAAQHLDDKDWDAWASLFTPDARYKVHALDLSGRDEIVATLSPLMASALTKHLLGYPVVDVDGDAATARTDLTTMAGPKGSIAPVTTGRYVDTLVRTPEGWRIAARILHEVG